MEAKKSTLICSKSVIKGILTSPYSPTPLLYCRLISAVTVLYQINYGPINLSEIEPHLLTKCCSVTVKPPNTVDKEAKKEEKKNTSKRGLRRKERSEVKKYEHKI